MGNHDEGFRKYLNFNIDIGRIQVSNRLDYIGVNGKKYLVVHGDMFDQIMITKKWLMHIGDTLYQILIWTNTKFNKIRGLLGMQYWSLSKWLKHHTKQALNYVYKFEENVAQYCRRKGYDGIICGHIHTAGIRDIDGIEYMNDGDWVESCSALVEHNDGKWEIIYYTQYK